ncbi:hypothetical protein DPMN_004430 [Dreissena polymorpha]|uniref:Uncharacterized protein n=1 Tax=Dreissena polymorpha TaxID=45954 RepID=A0A9D4RTJ4_DREPO|nr:hypothetical protein DPMN_004430 [Dreissena polymorpha]
MQQTGDFTKLTEKMNQKKKDFEGNAERLKMPFEDQLDKINTLRKKLNDTLDQLESDTTKEQNTLLETLKAPLRDDIDRCIDALSMIQNIQNEIQKIDKNTETLKLIVYRKCLEKSSEIKLVKSQMVSNRIPIIKFIPDSSIERIFSMSSFGKLINPNEILKLTGHIFKYNMIRWRNFSKCRISQICETDSGDLLVIDEANVEAKLLDTDFKVLTHYKFTSKPMSMCSIDSSLVAVAVDNNEVHYIRVTDFGKLVQDTKLKLEHECKSIAYHRGILYITSGSAIYRYTVGGRLGITIYEKNGRCLGKD